MTRGEKIAGAGPRRRKVAVVNGARRSARIALAALFLAGRGAGAQPAPSPDPAGGDPADPDEGRAAVVSPSSTTPRSSTQSTPADPMPPPPRVAFLWPAKAYKRGVWLDVDIVATTIEPSGGGGRDAFVAMAFVPAVSAQLWGEMHGGGGFAEVEVPFGVSLSSLTLGDVSVNQRVLFGNPTFTFRHAQGGVDSKVVWSWGARITLPTNDGELGDWSEPYALAALSAARAGHDMHRFTAAYFVAGAPASFEWRSDQLLFWAEAVPMLLLPTFQRFGGEPLRAGVQGAAEIMGRTGADGIRLSAGLRVQGTALSVEDAAAAPAVPWFARPGGSSAASEVQRGFAEAAVEPFVGIEDHCWVARAGALIPFTRPLGFGIHPDSQFTVRLGIGQRF